MFFHIKENTLNEEKFLSICHECGYEPYLYEHSETKLNKLKKLEAIKNICKEDV